MRAGAIITRHELPFVRVLAKSWLEHHPGSGFSVLVIDDSSDRGAAGDEPFDRLDVKELHRSGGGGGPSEIGSGAETAIQLSFLRNLLAQVEPNEFAFLLGAHVRVYSSWAEPDVWAARRRDQAEAETTGAGDVLLVARSRQPPPDDGRLPTERTPALAGPFDRSFLGLRRCSSVEARLEQWIEEAERKDDFVAAPAWIDFLSGLLPTTMIVDPGFGVSFWNVHERRLVRDEAGISVNGRPLRSFHFDGYRPESPGHLTLDQNGIRLDRDDAVRRLCDGYRMELLAAGYTSAPQPDANASAARDPAGWLERRIAALERHGILIEITEPKCRDAGAATLNGPMTLRGRALSTVPIDRVEVHLTEGESIQLRVEESEDPQRGAPLSEAGLPPFAVTQFTASAPADEWAPGIYAFDIAVIDRAGRAVRRSMRVRWAPSGWLPGGANAFTVALDRGAPVLWWSRPSVGDPPVGRYVTVSGWAASPAGVQQVVVHAGDHRVRARATPADTQLIDLLGGRVAPSGLSGYVVVLDLGGFPVGEHELTVEVTAGDGQSVRRRGLIQVDPAERYRRWSAIEQPPSHATTEAPLVARPQPCALGPRLTVGVLPERDGAPTRLLASLSEQSSKALDVRRVAHGELSALLSLVGERGPNSSTLLLAPADAALRPFALAELAQCFGSPSPPDLVYWDEEILDNSGRPVAPRLKPGWSPELLLQHDYVGPVVALSPRGARAALAHGGLPRSTDEMLLELIDAAIRVRHLPRILSSRSDQQHATDSSEEALHRVAARRGRRVTISYPDLAAPSDRRLRWRLRTPPAVSVVIPTSGEARWLEPCLSSLRDLTSYRPLQIVLVHSGAAPLSRGVTRTLSTLPHTIVGYRTPRDGGFNFSHACNLGAARADGRYLLFLNDDVEALHTDWLEQMVEQASIRDVGGVGARLEWPEGLVQHCGMALRGLGSGPTGYTYETLAGHEPDTPGPDGLLLYTHECAAVTGACLMIPRDVLDDLGGWDLRFPLDFGDVDLCLRVWASGRRVVVVPSVRLLHHQSATREPTVGHEDERRFKQRWLRTFPNGDLWHHPSYRPFDDGVLPLPGDGF
jgi:GT2 family glycosyltransferase